MSDLSELDKYRYAGHSVIMGKRDYLSQDVEGVLSWFSDNRKTALGKYREFVHAGIEQGEREDLRGGGLIRSAGGLVALLSKGHEAHESADERILGSGEFVDYVLKAKNAEPVMQRVDEILKEVCASSGISAPRILGQSRTRNVCKARVEFFRRAQNEAGATVTELGRMTGRSHVAVLRALDRAEHEKNQGPEH